MSINNATASDWDRLRKQMPAIEVSKPTIDESMMKVYLDAAEEERDAAAYSLDKAKWLECAATHWGKEEDAEEEYNKYMRETDAADIAEEDEKDDAINPDHYKSGLIECIEAIEESMTTAAFAGYLKGNCMKYLWRYETKHAYDPLQDLQKAEWYLSRLIELVGEDYE